MEPTLLFEAGRVAAARGWRSPEIVPVEQARAMSPAGGPIVFISPPGGPTSAQARSVATLVGAGRMVLVITATDVSPESASWLPHGTIHVLGTPIDSGPVASTEPPDDVTPIHADVDWPTPADLPPPPLPHAPTIAVPPVVDPDFDRRCSVVSEAWLTIRDLEEWRQLVAYGDVGFPLAYSVAHGYAETTPQGAESIDELYRLLLDSLQIPDFAYASFERMLDEARARQSPPSAPPPRQERSAPGRTCTACGQTFVAGDIFCGNCGTAR